VVLKKKKGGRERERERERESFSSGILKVSLFYILTGSPAKKTCFNVLCSKSGD
jgi:hypothetical protein